LFALATFEKGKARQQPPSSWCFSGGSLLCRKLVY